MSVDWLIIAPHVDDAELGMGGYIARAVEENPDIKITVLVMCLSDYTNRDGNVVRASERHEEACRAAQVLGVQYINLEFDENRLPLVDYGYLVSKVELAVRNLQPKELFIPLPSFNQDHRVTHDVCVTACRNVIAPEVWAYEYFGNNWGEGYQAPQWGKCLVRLEQRHIDQKTRALKCHESQNLNPALWEVQAQARGIEADVQYAEAFYLMRWVY